MAATDTHAMIEEAVDSVRSVPRLYNGTSCDYERVLGWQLEEQELVLKQLRAGKNVSTEAEDIVGSVTSE
jgi:hypothetical protein